MNSVGKKENYTYYFSVEGETEEWYLDHINNLLNEALMRLNANFTVRFDHKKMDPLKYVKRCGMLSSRTIYHMFDHEGNERMFEDVLAKMKQASQQKNVSYNLAYSNISFELWIILHKKDFTRTLTNVNGYLISINTSYGKKFDALRTYKHENNFKSILKQISLDDVYSAINRGKNLESWLASNYIPMTKYNYTWYKQNPSLSLHNHFETIFSECLNKVNRFRKTQKLPPISKLTSI